MTSMMSVLALAPADGEDAVQLAVDIRGSLVRRYPGAGVTSSLSREDGVLSAPSTIGNRRLLLTEIANIDRVVEDGSCGSLGAACQLIASGQIERFETPGEELSLEPRSPGSSVRMLLVLSKRRDITRDQFIDYYENRHAPLALRILPRYAAYSRNYFYSPASEERAQICADVVTDVSFRDRAHFDAFKDALADRSIRDQIRADEQHLFDPAFKWVAVVEGIPATSLRPPGLTQIED